jgi:transcriptional regulator with XRE-family HTH domain
MSQVDVRRHFGGFCQALRKGYPQAHFAKQYGLTAGAVQDLEQARVLPSRAVVVLLHAIRMQPEFMQRAAKEAAEDLELLAELRTGRN